MTCSLTWLSRAWSNGSSSGWVSVTVVAVGGAAGGGLDVTGGAVGGEVGVAGGAVGAAGVVAWATGAATLGARLGAVLDLSVKSSRLTRSPSVFPKVFWPAVSWLFVLEPNSFDISALKMESASAPFGVGDDPPKKL